MTNLIKKYITDNLKLSVHEEKIQYNNGDSGHSKITISLTLEDKLIDKKSFICNHY